MPGDPRIHFGQAAAALGHGRGGRPVGGHQQAGQRRLCRLEGQVGLAAFGQGRLGRVGIDAARGVQRLAQGVVGPCRVGAQPLAIMAGGFDGYDADIRDVQPGGVRHLNAAGVQHAAVQFQPSGARALQHHIQHRRLRLAGGTGGLDGAVGLADRGHPGLVHRAGGQAGRRPRHRLRRLFQPVERRRRIAPFLFQSRPLHPPRGPVQDAPGRQAVCVGILNRPHARGLGGLGRVMGRPRRRQRLGQVRPARRLGIQRLPPFGTAGHVLPHGGQPRRRVIQCGARGPVPGIVVAQPVALPPGLGQMLALLLTPVGIVFVRQAAAQVGHGLQIVLQHLPAGLQADQFVGCRLLALDRRAIASLGIAAPIQQHRQVGQHPRQDAFGGLAAGHGAEVGFQAGAQGRPRRVGKIGLGQAVALPDPQGIHQAQRLGPALAGLDADQGMQAGLRRIALEGRAVTGQLGERPVQEALFQPPCRAVHGEVGRDPGRALAAIGLQVGNRPALGAVLQQEDGAQRGQQGRFAGFVRRTQQVEPRPQPHQTHRVGEAPDLFDLQPVQDHATPPDCGSPARASR